MIDAELVKENYARMPDEKLIALLKKDGLSVTYEAFIILKREYNKRKLDPSLLIEVESKRLAQSKEKVQSNFQRESNIIENKLWNSVIRLKAEGSTNKEIIDWLINEGVQPELAVEGVSNLEAVISAFYKRALKAMLLSMLLIFGGIALCLLALNGKVRNAYLFYGVFIAITPLRYIYINHKAYKLAEKAMEVIKEERKGQN